MKKRVSVTMDKISVLMAVYKEPLEWIKETLDSVTSQFTNNQFAIELVIVLDNPVRKAELVSIISEYDFNTKNNCDCIYVCNEDNIGLASSLNRAFHASTGNYLARIDADDINYPERFMTQYLYLKANQQVSLVGSGITRIDVSGKKINDVFASNNSVLIKIKAFYSSVAFHPTWFMKRHVFSDVKGYLPYPNAEDFDFLLRVIENKIEVHNISIPLIYYRVNPGSLSNKNALRQRKCQLYALKEVAKRKRNPNHIFCLKKMDLFIYSYPLTEYFYSLSQGHYNQAMNSFLNNNRFTALLSLTKSFLLCPWQAYHIYRQAKLKIIRQLKKI